METQKGKFRWQSFAWGFAVGVVVLFVFLLWRGWMTEGSAKKMAAEQAEKAVVTYATPACVARFLRQPNANAVAAWKELKGTGYGSGGAEVVEKYGLTVEPGQKLDSNTSRAIAGNCATEIGGLDEPKTPSNVAKLPKNKKK